MQTTHKAGAVVAIIVSTALALFGLKEILKANGS